MKKIKQLLIFACLLLISLCMNAETCKKNYLTAQGNQLFDADGKEVFLRGVNWFGFETQMGYFHGIWARDHKSMLQQIKDLGFNCIRIPWNNAILTQDISGDINAYGTDPYSGVSPMNEIEATKTKSLEILDIAIQWCQENNMKVILDNHSREPDGYMTEELWYTEKVSHAKWIEDWIFITERYKEYDAVIAMDINNEPHGAYGGGSRWGTGDIKNDWRLAAQECGNAILEVNPDVLIMVEGTEEFEETSYWWGGNLQGARDYPVELTHPEKLVYSPHEYGPTVHMQDWFSSPDFPDNMPGIWEENFNYLHTLNTSPLFFGEFGIKDEGGQDEVWFDKFVAFMGEKGHHWTFWCWNPNSGDTGGLLDDQWQNVVDWKMDKLRPYLVSEIPNCQTSVVIPVDGISVNPDSTTLNVGQNTQITANISPSNASNKNVTWKSSNETVATVNSLGEITAVSIGNATISAITNDGDFTATSNITVTDAITYTLTNTTSGMGTVSHIPAGNTFTDGTIVSLTATAESGYTFKEWTGDVSSNENPTEVVMNTNKVINAVFTILSNGCTNPTSISLTYKQDGAGDYCWVTDEDISYVSSWNLDSLLINGTDFTNTWADEMPAKIDGNYYISYKASFAWSHVEIFGMTKSSTGMKTVTNNSTLSIFPNPSNGIFTVDGIVDANYIKVTSSKGELLYNANVAGMNTYKVNLEKFSTGIYFVTIRYNDDSYVTETIIIK
ncbi:cellulase family glycosylhydrolase [Saccharicrinis aurantiacus]|uniref:cellulase family glycosylhydrolase n=1 Tax=Saccharicrinis aurantiacus TaxID=1849719 RepID=UPI0009F918FC|nr:cellulase family glycosylhydrolase [Saccharicrinis aurantiacus]